ncbi:hypothetical protein EV426DRAFT_175838 [Tirmania nivea]|nr:hypothetical protein EV426DRAFT_175838 [Tirmania nivea]
MSFSSDESDASRDDPSFIRRVRQEWEAGSSTRTPSSLASGVVRDLGRRIEAAKRGDRAAPEDRQLSCDFTPTPDAGITPGATKLGAIRWVGGTASSYASAIPDDAPESAQRPKENSPVTGGESSPADTSGDIFAPPSGPKAWREAKARAKGKGREVVGKVLPPLGPRSEAKAVTQRNGREAGAAIQGKGKAVGGKVMANKGGVVYGQKLCGEFGAGAKRLELKGNGRKRMPEAGEVWVEVLNANRPPSGRDDRWKQQLVRNFNAFAEQKGSG